MIKDVFEYVKMTLAELDLSWALIGGLAISAQTDPRFTEDIDVNLFLPTDNEVEQLIFTLQRRGWIAETILEQTYFDKDIIATVRFITPKSSAVHVDILFASSGIKKEIIEQAEVIEIFKGIDIPIAQIGHLLALKILSESPERPRDTQDIKNLIAYATPDDILLAKDSCRLISTRGFHRQRDLLERLEAHLQA
jgi:predicted nucleotidyltransferase